MFYIMTVTRVLEHLGKFGNIWKNSAVFGRVLENMRVLERMGEFWRAWQSFGVFERVLERLGEVWSV